MKRLARLKVTKELIRSVLQLPDNIKILHVNKDDANWIEFVIEDTNGNHLREMEYNEAIPVVKATVTKPRLAWSFKEVL